jgi:serine/threonine protein kinase
MSPEQAEAKPIDARSDLFSLASILYEMATGQRPFTGDTSISIISSIVKDTPRSVTEINPALPRELARIIRRALSKDLDRRYQTAKDLRNDLDELKEALDSGSCRCPRPRRNRCRFRQASCARDVEGRRSPLRPSLHHGDCGRGDLSVHVAARAAGLLRARRRRFRICRSRN